MLLYVVTCDFCGKQSVLEEAWSWISLNIKKGVSELSSPCYHFCSWQCVRFFVKKAEKEGERELASSL